MGQYACIWWDSVSYGVMGCNIVGHGVIGWERVEIVLITCQMFRCSIVQMFGCLDVQMFRCLDVQMFRCSDVQMFRCSDVQMFRCSNL